jgi:hypothetical protein
MAELRDMKPSPYGCMYLRWMIIDTIVTGALYIDVSLSYLITIL